MLLVLKFDKDRITKLSSEIFNAKYFLIVSIEAASDMCNHIISRNRLVHIYWEVDNEVIYELLQEDIQDIKEFVAVLMKFLSNKMRELGK